MEEKSCDNCAWHDVWSWVCCNGYSENVADFTDPEKCCSAWEPEDDRL